MICLANLNKSFVHTTLLVSLQLPDLRRPQPYCLAARRVTYASGLKDILLRTLIRAQVPQLIAMYSFIDKVERGMPEEHKITYLQLDIAGYDLQAWSSSLLLESRKFLHGISDKA